MSEIAPWFPIAASDDLVARHVYQGQLLGRELAVWRDDGGFVNVWENRCLHRGVRLTLGRNDGGELVCRYHGWRYASRTAGCTYIPAHPSGAPAQTICNVTFPAVERFGLIWTSLSEGGDVEAPASLVDGDTLALRALPFNAPSSAALAALASATGTAPRGAQATTWIEADAADGHGDAIVVYFVQPLGDDRCVVRGVRSHAVDTGDELGVLRAHHRFLDRLRATVEADTHTTPAPAESLRRVQIRTVTGTRPRLSVTVTARRITATDICEVDLRAVTGALPTAQPGGHVDVQLGNGLTRQYSLVNAPGEQDRYVIGVKREPASRGGSAWIHDELRVGDTLTISEPHHQFVLRRDSLRTLLIAGGIGITPLLAMAQALHANGLTFELHYFAQATEHVAFGDRLDRLGDAVRLHLGRTPAQTAADLDDLLAGPGGGDHVYACGPGPMLDAVRATAARHGWPDPTVHFEYFANASAIDTGGSFEIELARSGITATVPAGVSVLDVLAANGVALASSCRQGACGTCAVTVLDGTPLHQDVYLNATERAANQRMMTCVSRAEGARLVLDV